MLIINIKALPLMMPNVMAQASFIAKSEKYIEDLSAMLRARPTLPMGMAPSDLDTAMFMPHKHCAFKDCNWSGANDEELTNHLFDAHHGIFQNDIVEFSVFVPFGAVFPIKINFLEPNPKSEPH
jgi:hypothetical protein